MSEGAVVICLSRKLIESQKRELIAGSVYRHCDGEGCHVDISVSPSSMQLIDELGATALCESCGTPHLSQNQPTKIHFTPEQLKEIADHQKGKHERRN